MPPAKSDSSLTSFEVVDVVSVLPSEKRGRELLRRPTIARPISLVVAKRQVANEDCKNLLPEATKCRKNDGMKPSTKALGLGGVY